MKKFFKNLFLRVFIFTHTIIIRISTALYKVDQDVLKADPLDLFGENKIDIKKQHHNPILEKMMQGQRDEQFVKDYYEILKKADKFLRNASAKDLEIAADKYGMNLGKKDRWGRRYEHYGFFDSKHKSYGKTLGEAMVEEIKERTTSDDDYPIILMFDNRPIEAGLAKMNELVEKDGRFEAMNEYEKAKERKFPMIVIREKDTLNKIEQLTDFLHIKKIGGDLMLLEFFIQKKYKVIENLDKSIIFDEISNIKQVWVNDEYGEKFGFKIVNYTKSLDFDDIYDILKFNATTIEKIS